jgi:hypothetical protein
LHYGGNFARVFGYGAIRLVRLLGKAISQNKIARTFSLALQTCLIKSLLECLQPIKVATEELGRRGANLLSAEATINFLLELLGERTDSIGQAFYETIKERINKRRNKDIVSLIKFLQNKNSDNER